jgi:hypothetical protein
VNSLFSTLFLSTGGRDLRDLNFLCLSFDPYKTTLDWVLRFQKDFLVGILRSYQAFVDTHQGSFDDASAPPKITILEDMRFQDLIAHDNKVKGKEVTILTHPDFLRELSRLVFILLTFVNIIYFDDSPVACFLF